MSAHPARTALLRVCATPKRSTGLLVALALASGCNWISSADYKVALDGLDQDGDNISEQQGDCDDTDPKRYPGAEEIWYDGIDGDCGGDDDYDADKDNWVAPEYEGLVTEGVQGTGGLRAGDCNDADPTINPTAVDTWYDGVDTDCAGNDDNDADGDGYAAVEYGGDDCFDEDGNVHPGATEIWLDGVDSDCSGGSDYDADGDGYAPAGLGSRSTLYAPDAPVVPDGDCDDADPEVNESVEEVYYDGKDNDCDPTTADLDQDGDGFERDGSATEDCDDEDPAVYPGAEEVLGAALDYDCDGDASTFADHAITDSGPLFDPTGTLTVTGLQTLRVGAGPAHLWFAIGAESITLPLVSGEETAHESILAFAVPLDDSSRGIVRREYLSYHPQPPARYSTGDTFAFAVAPAPASGGTAADLLMGARGLDTGNRRALQIVGYNDATKQSLSGEQRIPGDTPYNAVSITLGDFDRIHAIGCNSDGSLDIVSGAVSNGLGDLTEGELLGAGTNTGSYGDSCALDAVDEPTLSVTMAYTGGGAQRVTYNRDTPGVVSGVVEEWTVPAVSVEAAEGGTNRAVVFVSTTGTVHVADDDGVTEITGVTAEGPVQAVVTGDTLGLANPDYIVSGVAADGTAWFAVGNNTDGYLPYELVPADGSDVVQAAAWLDDSGRVHTLLETSTGLRYGAALY